MTLDQLDELAASAGGKDATARYNPDGDIEITTWSETPPARAEAEPHAPAERPAVAGTRDERLSMPPGNLGDEPTVPDGAPVLESIADGSAVEVAAAGLPRDINSAAADEPTMPDGVPVLDRSGGVLVDKPAVPARPGATTADGTLARAGDVPGDTPAIVGDFLDRAGTLPHERAALLARIRENNLAKREALDSFARRAADITSRWDDISQLAVKAETSANELSDSFALYREKLAAKTPPGVDDKYLLRMTPEQVRGVFHDDPDLMRALDEYLRLREANARIQEPYHQAVSKRVGQMQELLDDLAAEHGLPRVKVEAGDDLKMGSVNGSYHDGKLTLRESDFLSNKNPLTFMEAAYHEFVHNQQDSLIVRSIVDDVERDIRRPVKAEDVDRVQSLNAKLKQTGNLSAAEKQELADLGMAIQDVRQLYRDRAGSDISDDRLRAVLTARGGKPLTPEERLRATDLARAWKESAPAGEALATAVDDLKVITGELRKLDQPSGAFRLIERLSEDNGTLGRHLFSSDAPPAEVASLVDAYRRCKAADSSSWPAEEARSVLRRLLEGREDSLVHLKRQLYQRYLSGFHEQEAWIIGGTMRAQASDKGITGQAVVAHSQEGTNPGFKTATAPRERLGGADENSVSGTPAPVGRILSIDESPVVSARQSSDGQMLRHSEPVAPDGGARSFTGEGEAPGHCSNVELRITGREDLRVQVLDKLAKMSGDHALSGQFPPPTSAELAQMQQSLAAELRVDVPVVGLDGTPTNLLDKLDKLVEMEELGAGQRTRILNILAEVRTALKRIDDALPDGSPAKGYQDVNWKHTRAEVDRVIDAAIKHGLDAHEMENAIIASIFSDSAKFPKTPNTPGNFLVHNIDGARAAAEVLPRYFDMSAPHNMQRLEHIYNAVREHQIGPPEFMASMTGNSIKGVLGPSISKEQSAAIESICKKIARPMAVPHVTDSNGVSRIAFTDAESELLRKVGIEDWYVPNPESPWYGASRAVIDGDSLINYASPDGWGKIAAIRGPETAPWFEDATIFDSLASARKSYDDAVSVVSPQARPLAESGLERTTRAVEKVKSDMQRWFKELEAEARAAGRDPAGVVPRNADGSIAFWDAPLKYPGKSALSPLEQAQFAFAKRIRQEMVRRLREMQGVFDREPLSIDW